MLPIGRCWATIGRKSEEDSAHGASQAHFQEQASKQGSTRSGNRRDVYGGCRQRICFKRHFGAGHSVAEYRGASGHYARRRRNLRRQPVDLLCIRQGKCCGGTGRESRLGPLWRLRRLPLCWSMRRLRLERLLGLRMRRLLRIVGSLPLGLLNGSCFRLA
jgi:hypothetical protein